MKYLNGKMRILVYYTETLVAIGLITENCEPVNIAA